MLALVDSRKINQVSAAVYAMAPSHMFLTIFLGLTKAMEIIRARGASAGQSKRFAFFGWHLLVLRSDCKMQKVCINRVEATRIETRNEDISYFFPRVYSFFLYIS